MMVLIPDGVADKIHERTVLDGAVGGWKMILWQAHMFDSEMMGLPPLDKSKCEFVRAGKVSAVYGDIDGCGHYVGVVIGPAKKARLIAKFLLSQWRDD